VERCDLILKQNPDVDQEIERELDLLRWGAASARDTTNRIIRKTSNHETISLLISHEAEHWHPAVSHFQTAVSHFQTRDGGLGDGVAPYPVNLI
jgi:hypothetical protein